MIVGQLEIRLYTPWVHSLKEKRMEVRRLLERIKNKFNVSAAEVGAQDIHQTIIFGIACVANDKGQADSILDHVLNFIEANSEAEIIQVERELR